MILLNAYAGLARIGAPLIARHLRRRAARGKEDPARLHERQGRSDLPRPAGLLVWLHGASIGETLAMQPLLRRFAEARPDIALLVTSGTVTSARLLAERLSAGAIHQYVPVDTPQAAGRFIRHWRPDLCLWFESELWPNLLRAASAQAPAALINARMSARSARRWAWARGASKALLSRFTLIAAQSPEIADRLADLGAPRERLRVLGNLKAAADPPPCDPAALARLKQAAAGRPCWLAASVHPGEGAAVLAAHRALKAKAPSALALIVPRHADAAPGLAEAARRAGFRTALRSEAGDDLDADVYIADTFGEMGLWLRLAPTAFIGGSLTPNGGHNPLEAAKLGCAVLHGPHVESAPEAYARLTVAGAARRVADGAALAQTLTALDDAAAAAMGRAALEAAAEGAAILDATWEALAPLLPKERVDAGP